LKRFSSGAGVSYPANSSPTNQVPGFVGLTSAVHSGSLGGVTNQEADRSDHIRLISIPAAADRLGISRRMAYILVSRGELPSCRIGRRVLVPMDGLRDFVERNTRRVGGDPRARR
jgi:excisionase family DNA binding protein